MIRERKTSLKQKLIGAGLGAAIGLAAFLTSSNKAQADVKRVGPGTDWDTRSEIQAIINAPGFDKIFFESGDGNEGNGDLCYYIEGDNPYDLSPNKQYIFNNVKIDTNTSKALNIHNGGDIQISGNLKIKNINSGGSTYNAIDIGDEISNNIKITGVSFEDCDYAIRLEDTKGGPYEPGDPAPLRISNCNARGGRKLLRYRYVGEVELSSPYAAVNNCTLSNMGKSDEDPTIDVPRYDIENTISNNVLINCFSLSDPEKYESYSSPEDNAYDNDVDEPYLKEPVPLEQKDSVGNFVTSDMQFISGTEIPSYASPLNLGNGGYIGSKMPEGTAQIHNIEFSLEAKNPEKTEWKSNVWFDFVSNNKHMFVDMGDHYKLDAKYKVTLMQDVGEDGDQSNDIELGNVTNHLILPGLTEENLESYLVTDPESDYFGKYKVSFPMYEGPEFEMPGEIEHGMDIYAKIENLGAFDISLKYEQFASSNSSPFQLPEPSSLALIALGAAGAAIRKKKRRK
jgi:hypothetical protein